MNRLNFRVEARATGSQARAATFQTLHNEVRTPLFMPVGTQATVKAPAPANPGGCRFPGPARQHLPLAAAAGAGGFPAVGRHSQLHELAARRADGFGRIPDFFPAAFACHDGSRGGVPELRGRADHPAQPELSIETQKAIGSDIMMALDQCVPSTADDATVRAALGITHRWATRSLAARGDSPQAMFGIIQGALFRELRRESALRLGDMAFDGLAIGGLAVGESRAEREDTCEFTTGLMPPDRPRYLMGVGTPLDILEAVHRGVDMFDCIIPTQVAQRGGVFTSRGYLQLRRGVYRFSEERLDPACGCPTCQRYARAYLHHLTKTKETLGWHLLGQHNIYFYHRMMREIRESILADRFLELYRAKRVILHEDDIDNPVFDPGRNP